MSPRSHDPIAIRRGGAGWRRFAAGIWLCASTTACVHQARSAATDTYSPRTRALTVTTVPLLVRESRSVYPFLGAAFARGGALEGKEVYAFVPSTLTVVEGDTIAFTFVNPEDDLHSFLLPDLVVQLPGDSIVHATYVARQAGIFPILCRIPSHLPMMSGQLIVLAPSAVAVGHP